MSLAVMNRIDLDARSSQTLRGAPASISPSLRVASPNAPKAYEIKFLLDEATAVAVEQALRPSLSLDPHADMGLRGAYRTTTLYCDTPELDVLRRAGRQRRRKYRLRRYGDATRVFLERKAKKGNRVRKLRSDVGDSDICRLADASPGMDWPGRWFHEQIVRRALRPVCRVQYLRTAWFGMVEGGPVRVTFDRDVRGLPTEDWCVAPFEGGVSAFSGQVICEFKFHGSLPALLKSVLHQWRIEPRGASKYRACFQATKGGPADA